MKTTSSKGGFREGSGRKPGVEIIPPERRRKQITISVLPETYDALKAGHTPGRTIDTLVYVYSADTLIGSRAASGTMAEKLTHREQKKLLSLIAQISERSFRRGVQQAATFVQNGWKMPSDLHAFRYGTNANKSIGLNGDIHTSVERVICNDRSRIEEIGLI